MRFYELFTHCNTLNPSDTVIKCFSRCTYINIAISVLTRTGYNEQIRLDLRARYIRFLLYNGLGSDFVRVMPNAKICFRIGWVRLGFVQIR